MLNPDNRIDLQSCPNCIIWIANADDSGIDNPNDFHRRFKRNTANISDLFVGDDIDPHFSWNLCDTCGELAGDRYTVIAYFAD